MLAGTYSADVTVEGACVVNAGPAVVEGNLTVSRGAVLLAAFAEHSSKLTVQGNLQVQRDATLILGCEPQSAYPCLDNPAGSSGGRVSGDLSEHRPLGVVVHSSTIGGNVQEVGGGDDRSAGDDQSGGGSDGRDGNEVGGGGGFTCNNKGPTVDGFPVFGAAFGGLPVYSGDEDSAVHGNLSVIGLTSCWLGVARVQVSGNVDLINNQLADPDAIEILSNQISGNLRCQQNSQVWDSAEHVPGAAALFPRDACPTPCPGIGLASACWPPSNPRGPSGPGAF